MSTTAQVKALTLTDVDRQNGWFDVIDKIGDELKIIAWYDLAQTPQMLEKYGDDPLWQEQFRKRDARREAWRVLDKIAFEEAGKLGGKQ